MKIEYDRESDMAYISLKEIGRGEAKRTIPVGRPIHLNLDLDADNRLIGIEVFDARTNLPEELLKP